MVRSHILHASTVFIASVAADALCAFASAQHADVPASFRGVGLTLLCLLASPTVAPKNGAVPRFAWLQRPALAALLFAVAFAGEHHGGDTLRALDAIYTLVALYVALALFSAGGMDESSKLQDDKAMGEAKEATTASWGLAVALYSNVRALRAGALHAEEAVAHLLEAPNLYVHGNPTTRGIGVGDDLVTMLAAFSGGCGVAAACLGLYYQHHSASLDHLARMFATTASFQAVAALGISLAVGNQVEVLPALFGETACYGNDGLCVAANDSRRFIHQNSNFAAILLSSAGFFILSLPPSSRLTTRAEAAHWQWRLVDWGAAIGVFVFGVAVAQATLGPLVVDPLPKSCLITSVFALFLGALVDQFSGTLLHTTALLIALLNNQQSSVVQTMGGWALFSLFFVHVCLCIIETAIWSEVDDRVAHGMGVVTVALASVATGLYLLASLASCAHDGSVHTVSVPHDVAGACQALTTEVMGFFHAGLVVITRCEPATMSPPTRRFVWTASGVVTLSVGLAAAESPLFPGISWLNLAAVALACGVPWAAIGITSSQTK